MDVEYQAQLAKQPAAYQAGYSDGCQTGAQKVLGSMPVKDEERFTSDAEYARGWSVGYNRCYYISGKL
jgi:hypothetical protein